MSLATLTAVHTVTIKRQTLSTGNSMGMEYTTPSTGTSVSCRVSELSASEVLRYRDRGYEVSHEIYFSSDPGSLTPRDVIVFGSDTLKFVAMFKESDGSGVDKLWVVIAEKVTTRSEG